FGAIDFSRAAGYDLIIVGSLAPQKTPTIMSGYAKVIDVESGITVAYVGAEVETNRPLMRDTEAYFGLRKRRPDLSETPSLATHLASCLTQEILSDRLPGEEER